MKITFHRSLNLEYFDNNSLKTFFDKKLSKNYEIVCISIGMCVSITERL